MKRETSAGEPEPVEGTYTVPYLRMTLDGDHHLLPRYALHRDAVRAFLSGQLYEPHTHRLVTAFLRQHGGSMLHAGSFFGDMLPAFSRACEGMLHAFEPVLESYVLARTCVELNRLDNVLLFHAALAHQQHLGFVEPLRRLCPRLEIPVQDRPRVGGVFLAAPEFRFAPFRSQDLRRDA